MKKQNLFIKNRFGEKLEVLVRKLDEKGKFPAILLVPGFGMDLHEYKNSFDEISEMLVKKGFLTLQFSFAGCGKSEGNFVEMTFRRQAAQVKDMFDYLTERRDVNKKGKAKKDKKFQFALKIGWRALAEGEPTKTFPN